MGSLTNHTAKKKLDICLSLSLSLSLSYLPANNPDFHKLTETLKPAAPERDPLLRRAQERGEARRGRARV